MTIVKVGGSLLLFGIGIYGCSQYIKNVNSHLSVIPAEGRPSVQQYIKNRFQFQPFSMLFTKSIDNINHNISPQSLTESLFTSWVFKPEQLLFKLTVPRYEPYSNEIGSLIYGMFKIEESNKDYVSLKWRLFHLEGVHIISINKLKNEACFETVFWSNHVQNPLLKWFHIKYSEMLLTAAVNGLK